MAANNMQQMAAAQQLQQQRAMHNRSAQLQHLVYNSMLNTTQALSGWQTTVQITERVGKCVNLITNAILAMPQENTARASQWGITFEKDAFFNSPDRTTYEAKLQNKISEIFRRRQANEQNLQNTLQNQQAQTQQAQQQAQQQQFLLNQGALQAAAAAAQMRAQNPQQGFQHLQHQMQASPIPQPGQQPGMNPGVGQIGPNGQPLQNPMGGVRPQQPGIASDMSTLTQQERQKVLEVAQKMYQGTSEITRSQLRIQLQSRLPPAQLQNIMANRGDPVLFYFQQQAFQQLQQRARELRQRGMMVGGVPGQQVVGGPQMQQQPGGMNAGMMGQQPAGMDFNSFNSNVESIMNQQKQGMLAEQAGQIVVPASNGQPRGATPQPIGGVGQMPQGNPMGPNQGVRPGSMPQMFNLQQAQQQAQQLKMDQAAAQSQAQIRAQAQAKHLNPQQPGATAIPPTPGPGMAGVNQQRPGVPMNLVNGQGMPQGAAPGQHGGMDARFAQAGQRPMAGNFAALLNSMPIEQRQRLAGMSADKLNDVMVRWQEQQRQAQLMAAQGRNPAMMQGARPVPQPGQMNAGVVANGLPADGMSPAMPAANAQQAQAVLQQQLARLRQNVPLTQEQLAVMNSMDLPPSVTQTITALPHTLKKWAELRTWVARNPNMLPRSIVDQLETVQKNQYRELVQKRTMARMGQAGMQPGAVPLPPGMQPNGAGPGTAGPPNLPQFPPNYQISPAEIQQARQHKNFQGMSDDQIRGILVNMKKRRFLEHWSQQQQSLVAQQQQQQQHQQGMMTLQQDHEQNKQLPITGQGMSQGQPQAVAPVQPMQTPTQTPVQKQVNVQPVAQPMPPTGAKKPSVSNPSPSNNGNNRGGQPTNPSPANAPKSLKRPSPDAEPAPAPPAATASTPVQRNPSQQQAPQRQPQQLTQAQLAKLSPEQRQQYEQSLRSRPAGGQGGGGPSKDDVEKLRRLSHEVQTVLANEPHPDIPMTPEQHADTLNRIMRAKLDMLKIGKALAKWYYITRDDSRAKMFFASRLRLMEQFKDSEKMTIPRETFSIKPSDLDSIHQMLNTMGKDLLAAMQSMRGTQENAAGQGQGAAAGQGQVEQATAPAAANAPQQKPQQQQAQPPPQATKMHQRQNSKAGQAPAAPTQSQPPFAFGASSPQGQPTYGIKPSVTQENLQLPPSRKRQKPNPGQQSTSSASTSPQASKVQAPTPTPSADTKRPVQPPTPTHLPAQDVKPLPPPKPLLPCNYQDCDMSMPGHGFQTEELLRNHIDDEHIRPYVNPDKYLDDQMLAVLGLDPNDSGPNEMAAPPMSVTPSKQGMTTTPMTRTDSGATAMSREPSVMKRQASGGFPGVKQEGGRRMQNMSDMQVAPMGARPAADPWAGATVDPQSLFASLGGADLVGKGVFPTDLSLYRSVTPNDTPESSKDSGASEPTSDISDNVGLEIDLNWQPFPDPDMLLDMSAFTMTSMRSKRDGPGGGGITSAAATGADQEVDVAALMMESDSAALHDLTNWGDLDIDFNKPFSLDTSMYSMDV